MTPQEVLFVSSLLRGLSKRDSAIEAGYKPESATRQAHKLLQRECVKDAMQDFHKREDVQNRIDRERLRRILIGMAEAKPSDAFDDTGRLRPWAEIPAGAQAMLSINTKRWGDGTDPATMGVSSAVKMGKPLEAVVAYLKLFPVAADNSASNMQEVREEVEAEMEALIERMNVVDVEDIEEDEDE
jgi:hypothetical protein